MVFEIQAGNLKENYLNAQESWASLTKMALQQVYRESRQSVCCNLLNALNTLIPSRNSTKYTVVAIPCHPTDHGGFEPFPSLLEPPNPRISPTSPPGFGTGHSLFCFLNPTSSISSLLSSAAEATFTTLVPSFSSTGHFRLLRLLPACGVPSSAYATLGAGHGSACGKTTTKKLAKRVVANKEEVKRLRGCMCGGIVDCCEPSGLN